MIEDGERFFQNHPDAETRRRGLQLIQVIRGLREQCLAETIASPPQPAIPIPPVEDSGCRAALISALEAADWNSTHAALSLGLSMSGFYARVNRAGIHIIEERYKAKAARLARKS